MSPLKQDYHVYLEQHELEKFSLLKKMIWLTFRTTFVIVLFFRLAKSSNILISLWAVPIYKLIRMITGVQISRHTVIGGGLFLPHFGVIVLNRKAKYGCFLTLFHGVTVGAKGSASSVVGLPSIGDHVTISTGAIILGAVSIGDHATIGAGSVVVKDAPNNSVVVGNPGKVIR